MKHATAILIFLVLTVALVAYMLADPVLFLAGMIVVPAIMQDIPWGLASEENEQSPEDDDYNESSAGFMGELKERAPD